MMELVNVNDGGKNNEVSGQAGGLVTQEDWARYNDKLLAGQKGAKPGPSDYLDLPSPFDHSDDKIRISKRDQELKGPKCIDFNGSDSDTDTDSSQGSHSQEYLNEQLGSGSVKDYIKKGGIKEDFFDADPSRSVKPDIFPGPTFYPEKPDYPLDGGPKVPGKSQFNRDGEILLDISSRPAPILTQPFTVNRDGTISRGTTRSAPLGK